MYYARLVYKKVTLCFSLYQSKKVFKNTQRNLYCFLRSDFFVPNNCLSNGL